MPRRGPSNQYQRPNFFLRKLSSTDFSSLKRSAHARNLKCAPFRFQKIFRIDDDDDDDDDLEIRVSRDNEDRCFHSFSAQDGGNHISQYYGTNRDNCLPPLVKGEHDSPWPECKLLYPGLRMCIRS